ncbi:hypothetical protein TRVL_09781 [Trypanosoma vivax]|nr:hypothetical protein TRVL_09781 [Trypanosoma vivax]
MSVALAMFPASFLGTTSAPNIARRSLPVSPEPFRNVFSAPLAPLFSRKYFTRANRPSSDFSFTSAISFHMPLFCPPLFVYPLPLTRAFPVSYRRSTLPAGGATPFFTDTLPAEVSSCVARLGTLSPLLSACTASLRCVSAGHLAKLTARESFCLLAPPTLRGIPVV